MTLPIKCLGVLSATLAITLICAGCKLWPTSEEPDPVTVPFMVQLLHPGIDPKHPKEYTLYQVRGPSGLVTGYTMLVDSVSCSEDVCQIALVTMSWDALGQYTGLALKKGTALEKVATGEGKGDYKAVPFADADNARLHEILKDKESILKNLNFRNLVAVRDGQKLDAVSGATPLSVQEAVVEGAALTCYHLWHWANGDVNVVARELTSQSCDERLLSSLLSSSKPHYVSFALDNLQRQHLFGPDWVKKVNLSMWSGNRERIGQGYAYLLNALPDEVAFYDNLATLFTKCTSMARVHLLGLLESGKDLPDSLFEVMAETLPSMDSYREIHRFLSLLERHDYVSPHILTKASEALDNPNFFISRRAYWYLEKNTVNEHIKQRLQDFRKKCEDEGRVL